MKLIFVLSMLLAVLQAASAKPSQAATAPLSVRGGGPMGKQGFWSFNRRQSTPKQTRKKAVRRRVRRRSGTRIACTVPKGNVAVSSSSAPAKAAATATASLAPPAPPVRKSCFPALDFDMPDQVPGDDELSSWWCDPKDEYAFMGFSYSLASCPSASTLVRDFKRQRKDFDARYVRLYSACDRPGIYNDIINAAWEAGVGIYPLIWFGFDGTDEWKGRKAAIIQATKNNPKAKFVTRGIVVGSEPLFDWVLPADQLAAQIVDVRKQLRPWTGNNATSMQVTLSEMAWAFSQNGDAPGIFSAQSVVQANVLPFFDGKATTGSQAWNAVQWNYDYLAKHGQGKKILFTQTGWPSNQNVWKSNSPSAVASVAQEKAYFDLLDSKCKWMKQGPNGGVGWFAHIYSDNGLPGWGILDYNGNPKFDFSPRTSC